ncbi:MAG: hypothetical protein SCALA702_34110 [Melioribacteraceae bacterium]|nr:MAG: hypothetical protein SCALA702_34110 [Melioribacteraceae bacterium]
MKKLLYILPLLLAGLVNAQDYNEYQIFQLKALKGVEKFGVYVWEPDALLTSQGITQDSLYVMVKERIAIPEECLVDFADANKIEGSPSLEVEATAYPTADGKNAALHTAVRFIQDVILDRDRSVRHYSAITWERDSLTIIPPHLLSFETVTTLEFLLDNFSKDFLYMNPEMIPDSTSDSTSVSDEN